MKHTAKLGALVLGAMALVLGAIMVFGFASCNFSTDEQTETVTYTVTFNTIGGTEVAGQTIIQGNKATKPVNPTKTATATETFTFTDWYTSTDGGATLSENAFDFDTEITSNITLYAKWCIFVKVTGATVQSSDFWDLSGAFDLHNLPITIGNLWVCDHEVTQKEYTTYCKYGSDNPSSDIGLGDNYPAYYVSWYDAVVYCNLRSMAEGLTPVYKIGTETNPANWPDIVSDNGKYCGPSVDNSTWNEITFDQTADGYRLPTEAEWEYTARGGNGGIPAAQTTYSGSDDIDAVAWYEGNSGNKVHEVKGKNPNGLNIYDMSGNVREWCCDRMWGNNGAARGGDITEVAWCSVKAQMHCDLYSRSSVSGFRVVRNAQ